MSTETDTEDTLLRDVALAIFSAQFDGETEPDARREQWNDARREQIATARKVLHRLTAKGYTVSKTG